MIVETEFGSTDLTGTFIFSTLMRRDGRLQADVPGFAYAVGLDFSDRQQMPDFFVDGDDLSCPSPATSTSEVFRRLTD